MSGRRGVVCLAGYYEWSGEGAHKQPYYISVEGQPLLVACVWDYNRTFGITSFAIITTDAPRRISAIHSRAPLVLTPAQADTWIHGKMEEVSKLLEEGETTTLLARMAQSWAVTKQMGKISYQEPDCATPVANVPSPKKQLGIGAFFSAPPSESKKRPGDHDGGGKVGKKAAN